MTTFLPYACFDESARCLDDKRLGKQRVEALQITRILGVSPESRRRWRGANHPAVLMWDGYADVLGHYALAVCREWVSRGFQDTVAAKVAYGLTHDLFGVQYRDHPPLSACSWPWWLHDERLHLNHRAALLVKWEDDELLKGRSPLWGGRAERPEAVLLEWGKTPLSHEYWWPVRRDPRTREIVSYA